MERKTNATAAAYDELAQILTSMKTAHTQLTARVDAVEDRQRRTDETLATIREGITELKKHVGMTGGSRRATR